MTMKTISVSEAKATLSEQLRRVRNGEEVVITDRGRAVARLAPVARTGETTIADLEDAGLVRCGARALGRGFWTLPRPKDADGVVRASVRNERETGW